jgi:hypothetical protein
MTMIRKQCNYIYIVRLGYLYVYIFIYVQITVDVQGEGFVISDRIFNIYYKEKTFQNQSPN